MAHVTIAERLDKAERRHMKSCAGAELPEHIRKAMFYSGALYTSLRDILGTNIGHISEGMIDEAWMVMERYDRAIRETTCLK